MIFIALTGFFSPSQTQIILSNIKKNVPQALEAAVLNVMGWSSLRDVPMGEHELTANQAKEIMELVSTPYRGDLMYCMGLCSND
ncbi:pyocin S6 family toxin immunity protein [Pseudomonas lini]